MTAVVKRNACYWLLLVFCTSFAWQTAYSSIKTCNLNSEPPECVQHCDRSVKGKESCSLSCKKNNGTAIAYCNQVCDPADGNGKKCSFHCHAVKECVQQCTLGNCKHMKCARNKGYCEQYCTGGGCKNMVCHSDYCFQNCRSGGCNMRCGPHVKYCEQICTGGRCQIACEGKICRAYCPQGTCKTTGPNSAIQTKCNIKNGHRCVQSCNPNGCYCKTSGHYTHCKQACEGESCKSITCHSKTCRQDCGSNCSLTCSADTCIQECSGSGCTFQCSGNVRTCRQICKKGHCEFNCGAKQCDNECYPTGTCTFNEIGDKTGSHLDAKCNYRHNGQCEPQCKACVHGNKDLKCDGKNGGKCNQNCLGGLCKNVKCTSKNQCTQNCPGGRCGNLDCQSGICDQRCSGGGCAKIQCTANNCTQVCLGNCTRMVCNAPVCDQYCYLGGCNLECDHNVSVCRQTCYSGQCNFVCNGRNCQRNCPEGICVAAVHGAAMVVFPQYLYIMLIMAHLSLYIGL